MKIVEKRKKRLVRVLFLTALILGGVAVFSYYWPKISNWPKISKGEPSEIIEAVQEKIEENEFGKTVFKILGEETEKETEEKEKEEKEEEEKEEKKEQQSIVETVKKKITSVIIEKSSQKIIDILKTLPPEEFEDLKKEFCPKFCQEE